MKLLKVAQNVRIFYLIPNKIIEYTYTKAFLHLKSQFLKNDINSLFKILFVYFEKAIISLLLIVWSFVQKMIGFRFRLSQS